MSVLYKHDNFVNKNNQLNYFDSEVAVVVVVRAILNSSGELQVIIFIYKYNFFSNYKARDNTNNKITIYYEILTRLTRSRLF